MINRELRDGGTPCTPCHYREAQYCKLYNVELEAGLGCYLPCDQCEDHWVEDETGNATEY